MSDKQTPPSRMAGQPAPEPAGPLPPKGARPSYGDLREQAAETNFDELATHLDDTVRIALELPPRPAPIDIDRALSDRVREYFLRHPERIRSLPDTIRDLLAI